MSNYLVTYSTNAGSTADVAAAIAAALREDGGSVEVRPMRDVTSLEGYDTVILGAPMILGWHAQARRFLKRNRTQLAGRKVAYFACALRLTGEPGDSWESLPITVDPGLLTSPRNPGRLNFKERFTTIGHYLAPIRRAAPSLMPVSIAFFNGKLDLRRLKWWQVLFVLVAVQVKPGDHRDMDFIRGWARQLARSV